MAAPRPGDLRAGFTGLVVAAVFLLIVLTTIVKVTSSHDAHEKPAAAAQK